VAKSWVAEYTALSRPHEGTTRTLNAGAERLGRLCRRAWAMLDELPPRSRRNTPQRAAGTTLVDAMMALCSEFYRIHRRPMYQRLSGRFANAVRIDELLWSAAERWPGVLPSRAELAGESRRMQADKDGRELHQGLFVSQLCADASIGNHLLGSMLAPTEEARERLDEFVAKGALDLGTARVEAHGEVGYVYFTHPHYLNAEDDETLGPLEVAVDLVLLHPRIRLGVLRGDPVNHPKYKGRRIFSAGINLTRLYHGKQSYLFYLLRDMGVVNKIFRGLATPGPRLPGAETNIEKPWLAVVDGFAIGGGCQLLLVVDYVIAEAGAYFSLPARKEGIIPGCANLRLARFLGAKLAREAILFGKAFEVESAQASTLINEVHPRAELDRAVEDFATRAASSGLIATAANRRALRVATEPLDTLRQYFVVYAAEQAFCHLSERLIENLERHWRAGERTL